VAAYHVFVYVVSRVGRQVELYVLPDDNKRYAIETCRSSESVLKKWFKINDNTISAFVGSVMISDSV